jgi:hypothetical protein
MIWARDVAVAVEAARAEAVCASTASTKEAIVVRERVEASIREVEA